MGLAATRPRSLLSASVSRHGITAGSIARACGDRRSEPPRLTHIGLWDTLNVKERRARRRAGRAARDARRRTLASAQGDASVGCIKILRALPGSERSRKSLGEGHLDPTPAGAGPADRAGPGRACQRSGGRAPRPGCPDSGWATQLRPPGRPAGAPQAGEGAVPRLRAARHPPREIGRGRRGGILSRGDGRLSLCPGSSALPGSTYRDCRTSTTTPRGRKRKSSSMSSSAMRMQPREASVRRVSGSVVPWAPKPV